ncbi:MAG TPA: hypothetical protein VHI52_05950, partial [Verrucomicrobiae bacterium]|nr:hypothetical protein [Verrucomicrobiae bacterium]
VNAAIAVHHGPVRSFASKFFFLQPAEEAQREVELALKSRPTLVLGADFLFWFCYGDGRTDQERLQRFEQGLKLCDEFRCPLVLGDIPDASNAVDGMLSPDEVPHPSAIAAANRRLRAWAASRSNVVVLSLSNFMATVVANRALSIHGRSLPGGSTRILLQADNLHPSPPGCAVLSLLMLDAFQTTRAPGTANEIIWDSKQVFRTAYASAHSGSGGTTNAAAGASASKDKKDL